MSISAVQVPNPTSDTLSPRARQRLRSVRVPNPSALTSPGDSPRFRPLVFSGPTRSVGAGAIDPDVRETFRFSNATPTRLKARIAAATANLGFSVLPDNPGRTARRPGAVVVKPAGGGTAEVSGSIYAERELRADLEETRRRNRSRWAGVGAGVAVTALGIYFALFYFSSPAVIFEYVAALGLVIVLSSTLGLRNVDFWSDLIVVSFRGNVRSLDTTGPAVEVPGDYEVQVSVVRALTQNWTARHSSGRALLIGVRGQGLDDVRSSLRAAITSSQLV
jgi:hypothetical protein